ncbi:hypothetical protein ABPG72_020106 [Tetrahymena utriculariae]
MEEEISLFNQLSSDQKVVAQKYKVIVRYLDGFTYQEISDETGFPKGTISKLIAKFKTYGDVLKNIHSNAGRQKILDEDDKYFLEQQLNNDRQTTLKSLQSSLSEEMNKQVSLSTLHRYEQEIGSLKLPLHRPLLSNLNKIKRYEYSLKHQKSEFKNYIFMDESYFTINRITRRVFVFHEEDRPIVEIYNPQETAMVWAAICRKGKVCIEIIEGSINKESYLQLLQRHFPESGDQLYGRGKWQLLHDNAPAHKATVVKDWINTVTKIADHPPQSPDLNPIELLWNTMKNEVEMRRPQTKQQLCSFILESWQNLNEKTINSYIDHKKTIIQKIIEQQGNNQF